MKTIDSRAIWSVNLALPLVTAVLGAAQCKSAEVTYKDIKNTAREAIRTRSVEFDSPRVDVDNTNKTISLYVGSLQFVPVSSIDMVLSQQMQLESYRAGYGRKLSKEFWEPLIVKAEDVVKNDMMRIALDPKITEEYKQQLLSEAATKSDKVLEDGFISYAKRIGYTWGMKAADAGAWAVTLRTNPAEGRILICSIVTYNIATKQGKNPEDCMVAHPDGDDVSWSGVNVIKAVFPDGKTYGPMQHRVGKSGTLTITPKGTRFDSR